MKTDRKKEYDKKWFLEHPEKLRKYKKKYYLSHLDKVKEYGKVWRLAHPEYQRVWALIHPEKVKAKKVKYLLAHPEQKAKWDKRYRLAHSEKIKPKQKKNSRARYLRDKERILEVGRKYRRTPQGKEMLRKVNLRRRAERKQFGFIPLNEYFAGSAGHHIDMENVIFIPVKLHTSVPHSITKNWNMDKINRVAFNYLKGGVR